MAYINYANTGYVNDSTIYFDSRHIWFDWVTTSSNPAIMSGMMGFNSSINSVLGTSTTTFAQLKITAFTIKVRTQATMATNTQNNWVVGVDNSSALRGKFYNAQGRIAGGFMHDGYGTATLGGTNTTVFINFSPDVFNNIPTSSSFTPNSAPWYLYVGNPYADYTYFLGLSTYSGGGISTIEGSARGGTVKYYANNSFIDCAPYYFNGTTWVACEAKYYSNGEFKQVGI